MPVNYFRFCFNVLKLSFISNDVRMHIAHSNRKQCSIYKGTLPSSHKQAQTLTTDPLSGLPNVNFVSH